MDKKITVSDFMKKYPKEKLKNDIGIYKDDILKLKNEGYRLKDIAFYLSENGIKVSLTTISKYLKKIDQNKVKEKEFYQPTWTK